MRRTRQVFTSQVTLIRVFFKWILLFYLCLLAPPSNMSQDGYNNTGLGSVHNHLPGGNPSYQQHSIAQYHCKHSQPQLLPLSHSLPFSTPDTSHPPRAYGVPDTDMGYSLLCLDITACHQLCCVRIKPQACFDMFNGVDVER